MDTIRKLEDSTISKEKTEVDKLLDSINVMYAKLKGDEQKNRFINVKDLDLYEWAFNHEKVIKKICC